MKEIVEAILAGGTDAAGFEALPLPDHYTAVTVHKDEAEMFAGMAAKTVFRAHGPHSHERSHDRVLHVVGDG